MIKSFCVALVLVCVMPSTPAFARRYNSEGHYAYHSRSRSEYRVRVFRSYHHRRGVSYRQSFGESRNGSVMGEFPTKELKPVPYQYSIGNSVFDALSGSTPYVWQ